MNKFSCSRMPLWALIPIWIVCFIVGWFTGEFMWDGSSAEAGTTYFPQCTIKASTDNLNSHILTVECVDRSLTLLKDGKGGVKYLQRNVVDGWTIEEGVPQE